MAANMFAMSARRNRGFSLVELMVALVIGLVAVLAMTQVFVNSEGQRRTTGSGTDAQTAAAVALYSLQSAINSAGYALNSPAIQSCTTAYGYNDPDGSGPLPGSAIPNLSFFPIRIIDGGTGSDTIIIATGNTLSSGLPARLENVMGQADSDLKVDNTAGCITNGFAIVSNGTQCTLMQITGVNIPFSLLRHMESGDAPYNPSSGFLTANSWPKYSTGDAVLCLSNGLARRSFAVESGRLVMKDPPESPTSTQLAPDIVALKAQYGISISGDSDAVVNWVEATGSWANPSVVDRERIKAVRIGIVARSAQPEREDASSTCTTPGGVVNQGPCLWQDDAANPAPQINLSADPAWRRYRYKTYSTIAVLRNFMWKPPL
ncbi:MAG TPA: PilW family protein [Candidatus Desulfobacillus sp.]|nr:PilW family protein [Candidatus Desulfobacillus sp.]